MFNFQISMIDILMQGYPVHILRIYANLQSVACFLLLLCLIIWGKRLCHYIVVYISLCLLGSQKQL